MSCDENNFYVTVVSGWRDQADVTSITQKLNAEPGIVAENVITNCNAPVDSTANTARKAMDDLDTVKCGDLLLVVMRQKNYSYAGTFALIGAALVLGKPVVILCPGKVWINGDDGLQYTHDCQQNEFYWHNKAERVSSFEEALGAINSWRS